MKKYIIRNTCILVTIFLVVCFSTVGIYMFVNNLLVKETVSVNLTTISQTINETIKIKLNNDNQQLERFITNIPSEYDTINRKIEYANNHFEEISLSTDVQASFGYFYSDRSDTFYNINGIRYIGKNSTYNFEYEKQDIAICNFGLNYESFNETDRLACPNPFSDAYYIVFKLSNNIIAYVEADPYFTFITNNNSNITLENYYIISEDGLVVYRTKGSQTLQFYDLLREKNNDLEVNNIKDHIQASSSSLVFSNLKIGEETYFITIDNITNFTDTKTIYDLHLVLLVSDQKVTVFTRPITTSMISIIIFLNVVCALICVISYLLALHKYHVIDRFATFTNKRDLLVVEISNKGKVKAFNKQLKALLFDHKKYKMISDFTFNNNDTSIMTKILNNKEVVMHLDFEDTKNNEEYYIRFVSTKYLFSNILIGLDVTEEEKRKNRLLHVALYNTEIDLPNIYLLEEKLEKQFDVIKNYPLDHTKPVIISFDVENFNNYNILFGAYMSNKILRELARRINQLLVDTNGELFYIRNSLFMIYFSHLSEDDEIENWIKKAVLEFKMPLQIDQNNILINLYFGILKIDFNNYPNLTPTLAIDFAGRTVSKVMSFANKRYDYFDISISNFISSERLLEQDLLKAIDKKEFKMFLQPQYDNEKNRISGFESLIRWDNPKYRGQSPAHFIEVAERTSMIVQLGRFIFEETFRLAKELESYDVTISVNISPVQLLQAGFTAEIIDTAEKIGIDPSKIAIEITETSLMENFRDANAKLEYLRNHGFLIHLDDFGTGYSSLLYIKELKVDAIKIDREFIKNINNDQYSRIIVSKIIGIAKSLNLDIIAEGVEDEKQNQFLFKNGCNIIQGYLISRATSYEDTLKLLDKYNIKKETNIVVEEKPKTTKKTKSKK